MNHSQRGFNLIEMLMVLGIIIFIATLVAGSICFKCGPNRVNQVKAGLQKVANAVNNHYRDTGLIPPSIHALTRKPEGIANWKGPYLSEAQIHDPWGTQYQYRAPGSGEPFEVMSLGSDRAAGGTGDAQDLTNWDPTD